MSKNLNDLWVQNPFTFLEDPMRETGSSVVKSNYFVRPQSSLLLGKAISIFASLEEAKRKIDPEIFRSAVRVSGQEVSRDIEAGIAVENPAAVLRSLHSKPKIVSGNVVAGKPTNLQVLNF